MQNLQIGAPLNCEYLPRLQWIEVASSLQIPSFHIVGLPSPEVAEARERIRAAIEISGLEFPRRRIVLNLSPASIRKQGTSLELAMALAVLSSSASRKKTKTSAGRWAACGELGLDGAVKPVGQLTRAIYASWKAQVQFLFIPREEYHEAIESSQLIQDSKELTGPAPYLIAVSSLHEAWDCIKTSSHSNDSSVFPANLENKNPLTSKASENINPHLLAIPQTLERILGVSAAGGHHLLILGPRGSGKSHALEWLTSLHPPAPSKVQLVQMLLSEMISSSAAPLARHPIRRIGSQVRPSALLGALTPTTLRPGEFSLAHGGILVADELPEWARDSREALREPLERGLVTLSRTRGTAEFPARFTLAANGNFCPCGGWPKQIPVSEELNSGQKILHCECKPAARERYLARLSGPILDRIDLLLKVGMLPPSHLNPQDQYKRLKQRVHHVYSKIISRWGCASGWLNAADLEKILNQNPHWKEAPALRSAVSLRDRHKILRIALTLAEWDNLSEPSPTHFIEATCYRPERLGINPSTH